MNDVEAATQQYLSRLNILYDGIREWMDIRRLQITTSEVQLNEEEFPPYSALQLIIATARGETIARLRPIGHNILGAHGRLDIVGTGDTLKLVYLVNGGPTWTLKTGTGSNQVVERSQKMINGVGDDGWYWLEGKGTLHAHRLDESLFIQLLGEVSAYAD